MFFTGEDLESFGSYMVSEERRVLYSNLYSDPDEADRALSMLNERDTTDWFNIVNFKNNGNPSSNSE